MEGNPDEGLPIVATNSLLLRFLLLLLLSRLTLSLLFGPLRGPGRRCLSRVESDDSDACMLTLASIARQVNKVCLVLAYSLINSVLSCNGQLYYYYTTYLFPTYYTTTGQNVLLFIRYVVYVECTLLYVRS